LHPDLERLVAVTPPPSAPIEVGSSADWKLVEADLGVKLPDDYRGLIDSYGSGCFGEFLYPLNPFTANRHGHLLHRGQTILAAERSSGMAPHQGLPFALYPVSGGLLPWAVTDNGDTLFWYTHPVPWPVVVWSGRGFRFEVYQRSAAGFLAVWLAGQIAVGVFPAGPFPPIFQQAEPGAAADGGA
jgi:hypothetical protein